MKKSKNELTNEFLELRSRCSGKGIIYILIDPRDSKVSVFYPRFVLGDHERDDFLKSLLGMIKFDGRVEIHHGIWKSILKSPGEVEYYKFTLDDQFLEVTAVDLSEIIKTPL